MYQLQISGLFAGLLLNILIWFDDKPVYECCCDLFASSWIDIIKHFLDLCSFVYYALNLDRYAAIFYFL